MAKTPRMCRCGCQEETSGGRFMPGHDSRFVAGLVAAVVTGLEEEDKARAEVAKVSLALATKFDKALASRRTPQREKRVKAAEVVDQRAVERVDRLMARIDNAYWAGMTGFVRVGSEDVPAKVQGHVDGLLDVRVYFGPGVWQDTRVSKDKFRKEQVLGIEVKA